MAASRSTPQLQPASTNNKSAGLDELFSVNFGASGGTSVATTTSVGGASSTGNAFNPFQSQSNPWGGAGESIILEY